MVRPVVNMSLVVFEKALQEFVIKRPVETVILHKDGEPLINKNLSSYIDAISKARPTCKLDLYTNGLLLTEEFIRHLASKPNPTRVLISVHMYESNGKKNDYTQFNVLLTKVLRKPMPRLEFIFVTHKTKLVSDSELQEWQKYWSTLKCPNRITGIHVNPNINTWAGKVPDGNNQNSVCPYQDTSHLFIGSTGNVLPCCVDLEEEIVFGNILTDNIDTIMQRRMAFYKDIQAKTYIYPLCKRCVGLVNG
jgi:radical SAM protein with 4Fe4S-binding SPASM domain